MSEQRTCIRCSASKPLTEYRVISGYALKFCRECERIASAEKRAANPERTRLSRQRWSAANRERQREYARQYRAENPDGTRQQKEQWRAANPDSVRASHQRWLAANRERVNISNRARDMVSRAIKRGDLIRPSACEQCGVEGKRIEGAHADYSKPLEVRWLCKPCHARWDHDDPKTKGVHIPLNHAIGTRVSTAKLTEADVRLIREAYASGRTSGVKLAAEFGVRPGAVYQILRGRTWTHVS